MFHPPGDFLTLKENPNMLKWIAVLFVAGAFVACGGAPTPPETPETPEEPTMDEPAMDEPMDEAPMDEEMPMDEPMDEEAPVE